MKKAAESDRHKALSGSYLAACVAPNSLEITMSIANPAALHNIRSYFFPRWRRRNAGVEE